MIDDTSKEEIPQGTAEKWCRVITGRRYLKRGVGWGEKMGASKASLCVEIDGLDFPRKNLGHLHRDDFCHHFWKVHAHHVGLD